MPPNKLSPAEFATRLLHWYATHRRALPWRGVTDPYKIWISEVVLQQTRVKQGQAYYERFIERFPTLHSLAQASEEAVLHAWQGLGYYTRARKLHECARYVVAHLAGRFPSDYKTLCTLPGIGPYTAAAIASIAFGVPEPVLDGNVYRVLSRIFGIKDNTLDPRNRKKFYTLAAKLLSKEQAGDYNQAIMDFGALQCTPKPKCIVCVFNDVCVANQAGLQDVLPVRKKKLVLSHRYFHYLVFYTPTHIYLKKRTGNDIWRGLYDFYLVETPGLMRFDDLTDQLAVEVSNGAQVVEHPVSYRHRLTHQLLHIRFFTVPLPNHEQAKEIIAQSGLRPVTWEEVAQLPLPALLVQFFNAWRSKTHVALHSSSYVVTL